jgi:hypothetical protein
MHVFGLWENTIADHQEMRIWFSEMKISMTATHRYKKTPPKMAALIAACIIV